MAEELRRMGFIRTSSTDHHPNVQADALTQAGCTELHEADVNPRQAIRDILDALGSGDALMVYQLDRLERDEHNITNFKRQLEVLGITLIVTNNQETTGGEDEK